MGASLPPKEANLFKLIVKSYETKQYKKGLKAADAILKKFPDHGETLSMKGLTLNCMDRKSEAYELVRIGLKNDLKSHVCWHVYGLLYRSDREYREAIKCYRNALRIDPDNIEILRDLSLLQAQMRDLTGFVETRQQLLTLKPNHRMNWIGFAVAQHLNANALKAVEILEAYEGTLEDDYPPDNERCEHGEMLLYKISLLEECNLIERALEELHKKETKIVDKLDYKEQEVSLLVKLDHLEEGAELYRILLSMNPDNYRYYQGLQKCLGLYAENAQYSPDEVERLDALYKSLGQKYSWSSAVKRIPLDFLQGDKFREAADNYIRPLLTKGVPSLFSDLSPLYDHPGKADILEQLILELEHSIRMTGRYPGRAEKEPPSTLLWALFLLAQHYDRRGQYDIALSKIDEAMEHTPTVIDLYSAKSRVLKHAGDLPAAAALADEARCMDLADRYINSDCVKRMLQADQVPLAEKTAVLFTKDGDQHNNLHDMQCMWYELASGESYYRQGDLGRALKKFLAVEKHYADITEDQFDFHSYCLRKMTLRAYVEMLRFQDRLHSHAYFHAFKNPKAPVYPRLAQGKLWNEMTVTWTSGYDITEATPFVEWGSKGELVRSSAGTLNFDRNSLCGAPARTVGWRDPGFIHTAFLKELWPNTVYTYKVGHRLSNDSSILSQEYQFRASPYPGQNSVQRVVIFGDMGKDEADGSNEYNNFQRGSLNTTKQLIQDLKNIDIVFHIGDICYANGYISQWDQFTAQVEPIASAVPYMIASGNHERDWPGTGSFYGTTDSGGECGVLAQTMFYVPAENRAKFWYSTDYGMFRFCIADTEHDWREGTEQYEFIENCLASVDRQKQPWLIFLAHRVLGYSSASFYVAEGSFEEPMGRESLQKLWQKYKVDIAVYGHVHNYERTCPIYQNICINKEKHYYKGSLNGTIHVVAGGGGASLATFAPVQTKWSIVKDYDYGFVKLTAFDRSNLLFEYKKSRDGKVYDSFRISRDYRDILACAVDSCPSTTLAS